MNLYKLFKQGWNQGYHLVDVEYGDGIWFGTFQQATGTNGVTTLQSILPNLNKIFLKHGNKDGTWLMLNMVMVSGLVLFKMFLGLNAYETASSNGEFKEDIQNMSNNGYDLIDIEYGDGIWFGTFQQDSSITSGAIGRRYF